MKKIYTSSKMTWDKNSKSFESLIKRSFRNYVGTLLLGSVGMSAVIAQTNPTPQPIPYTQNFDALNNAYPLGWQGWRLAGNINSDYSVSAPSADQVFSTTTLSNNITAAHIGNIGQRLGFLNTTSVRTVPVLAVSTADRQQITIKYDINLQRVNSERTLGVQLQYRIGTDGEFIPIEESTEIFTGSGTGTNTSGTDTAETRTKELSLPNEVSFKENVQFRWVTARLQGGAGDNLGFSIDNIEVNGITDPCANNPLPYSEDFIGLTSAVRECTSVENVNNDDQTWSVYTTSQTGFTTPLLRYRWNTSNDANDWFYTKGLALEAGVNYRLRYKYGTGTGFDEKLKVAIGNSASNDAMTQVIFDHGTFRQGTATTKEVFFTVPSSGNYYIGFHAYSAKNMLSIYLDDIIVDLAPTCLPPTAVTTSNITHSTAEINWTAPTTTAGSYEYYISTTTTAPDATTTASGTTNSTNVVLSNLTPTTTYNVWVRSVCAADDKSEWTTVTTFQTGQIPAAFPYADNFDTNQWVFANGTQTNKFFIGTPTTANNVTYADNKLFVSNDGISNTYSTNGSYVFAYRDITLPEDLTLAKLQFDWIFKGEGAVSTPWDFARFFIIHTTATPAAGTNLSHSTDPITINGVNSIYQPGPIVSNHLNTIHHHLMYNPSGTYNGAFEDIKHSFIDEAVDLSTYAGQTVRLVFYFENDTSAYPPSLAIDNFVLDYAPSCLTPTNIATSNITYNSATISWTGNSDSYSYVISTEDTAPTGNTGTSTTDSTVNLTDLESQTTYYWWVKPDCDTENTWHQGPSFTTNETPQAYPFTDDFNSTNNFTLVNGTQVNKLVQGTPVNSVLEFEDGALFVSNDQISNTYTISSTSSSFAYVDIEVPADLTESTEISFDWYNKGENIGVSIYDYGRVFVTPTSYTPIAGTNISYNGTITGQIFGSPAFQGSTGTGATFNEAKQQFTTNVDLTAYAGQVVRVLVYWRNDFGGGTQPPLAIDNFYFGSERLNTNDLIKGNFDYYPNPVQNELNIKTGDNISSIEVYNFAGQAVDNVKVDGKTYQLNTSKLKAGVYMVKVNFENGSTKTVKIIKK